MNEFRIILHQNNEMLEQKIVQQLEPHCSKVVVVKEEGNIGLTISIISLVISIPGFIIAVKEIFDWIDSAAKKPDSSMNQNSDMPDTDDPSRVEIEVNGKKYDISDSESKEERNHWIDLIAREM